MHATNPISTAAIDRPFHLAPHMALRLTQLFGPLGCAIPERVLALPALNDIYADVSRGDGRRSFVERTLDALEVRIDLAETELSRIPKTGPLIVVSNHPFGGIDGLVLAALLTRVRPDVKLMANHLLRAIPELADTMLFVDPFGGAGASERNATPIRSAIRFVKDGGALGIFPAGEVSRLSWRTRGVADGAWSEVPARIAQITGAPVLPIFFDGRNSNVFQIAGLVHPILRTVLLPRELLKRRGSRVSVHVGSVIAPKRLEQFKTPEDATAYLRVRTHVLKGRSSHPPTQARRRTAALADEPIALAENPDVLASEIAALPSDRRLASSGSMHVYLTSAGEIPATLREIGRLREATFRRVGEGTGCARDLDAFDEHYLHLFVWNETMREIVGSYRLGLCDEILTRVGKSGLYTSTLFRFRSSLLKQLNVAVELGRSFVREEYQKKFAPLMLLWKGIGAFIVRNPKYRLLFGPVSISNEYRSLSKQILMAFLRANNHLPALAGLLSPRNPPRFVPGRDWEAAMNGTVVGSIEQVDELVGEIEGDRLRVPVLLRQYLKLRAKLLGFNVDPDFGDVLDGLMLVDLTQVDLVVLVRYMGREGAERFLASHRPRLMPACRGVQSTFLPIRP